MTQFYFCCNKLLTASSFPPFQWRKEKVILLILLRTKLQFYFTWQPSAVQPCGGHQFSSVQSLSWVQLFVTSWTAAWQASLSASNSWSLLKLMPIELVMPSNHLILCHPLILPPSIFPSIRVFSNETVLHIRWPEYWSFSSTSVLPMNIQDWFPLGWTSWNSLQSKGLSRVFFNITVQKYHFFGAQLSFFFFFSRSFLFLFYFFYFTILYWFCHTSTWICHRCTRGPSAFFILQLSHPYITTGKTIALTGWTFVSKVMSLLFNMLSRLNITFLPRSKCLLISWLQSPSAVILEHPQK